MKRKINDWFSGVSRTFAREMSLVFKDVGVITFFFVLPLFYPLVYTLIYNPELVRDIPVAVVDDCRTAGSRELVRMADATEAMDIMGYPSNMGDARRLMNEKECYGILYIPEDYSLRIGRGEQGVVAFYSEMSLLMRYRSFLSALTDLQLQTGAQVRHEVLDALGASSAGRMSSPVSNEAYFLGDPTQGFASFVIPGIVILILQQSMLLGVTMLAGNSAERRRRNGGVDPLAIVCPQSAGIIGRMLCYVVVYIPMAIYMLHYVPLMFDLPHIGDAADYLLFIVPLLVASAFLGMTLQAFVKERESSMLVLVFSSVVFLFLSGLTWPRYAMSPLWKLIGDCVPATWGVEGFININSNGASLAQVTRPYLFLWGLAAVYFVTAYIVGRLQQRKSSKAGQMLDSAGRG